MPKVRSIRLLTFAVLACGIVIPTGSQTATAPASFVIDVNRAFVYLRFDHIGKGSKRWDAEPERRIWLQFVNNCVLPISLRTYATPDGSRSEEVGVMDLVVKDKPMRFEITAGTSDIETTSVDLASPGSHSPPNQPNPDKKAQTGNEPEEMPTDYWFEVGSEMTVQPGKEVLFSIPVNQLGKNWHVEIPFGFKDTGGKFPRDPLNGGQPQMRLLYSLYDLPDRARTEIVGKGKN